jgi:hypothetical protein
MQSRYSIRAFVGYNGDGKSLAAVNRVVLTSWSEGRPVLSNMTLYPEAAGYPGEFYVPLTSWRQLLEVPEGWAVVIDEITSVLPARQAMSVPSQLQRITKQMRKGDHVVAWTDTNWSRADVILRECTQAVTVCRGHKPDRWQRGPDAKPLRGEDGRRLRWAKSWPSNRVFIWTTFNAKEFDDFTYSLAKEIAPIGRQRYRRLWGQAHRCYDTFEPVALMDWLDDSGVCVVCGGTRQRMKCRCPRGEAGSADEGGLPAGPRNAEAPQLVEPPAAGSRLRREGRQSPVAKVGRPVRD